MSLDNNVEFAEGPTSRRREVEERLRQAIVRGDFTPGAHLSDRALCQHFNVSRTLVREAVRALEAEGLVESFPNRGSFVRVLTEEEAVQIFDARGVLEAWATRKFVQLAADEEIEELVLRLEDLKPSLVRAELVELIEKKQRFYDFLFSVYRNIYIEKTLNQIQNWSGQLRAAAMSAPDNLARAIVELDRLIDAIRRRDEEQVWLSSLERVRNSGSAALSVIHERGATQPDHDAGPDGRGGGIERGANKAGPEGGGRRSLDGKFLEIADAGGPLQDLLSEYCRVREGVDGKTGLLVNLAMLTAANRPREIEANVRAALEHGISKDEIAEVFLQAAIHCGVPLAINSLRIARKVFDEPKHSPSDALRAKGLSRKG